MATDNSNRAAVEHTFCLFIGDVPPPEHTAAFVERLDSYLLSRTKLLQVVFESAIVQHSWQGLNSRDFVTRLHRALLSREAEPGEIAHWQTLLDSGRPRRSIIRMFATGEELARLHPIFQPPVATVIDCPAASALVNSDRSANIALQQCIDSAPAGATLELHAGRYSLQSTVRLLRPVVLRTRSLSASDPSCGELGDGGCAELIAAEDYAGGPLLLIDTGSVGVALDHIIVNGNRAARSRSKLACQSNPSQFGPLVAANGTRNLIITNTVIKNALCSTGLGVTGDAELRRNLVTSNGTHDEAGLWADGMILLLADSWVVDNVIQDNTDVDLIIGGCPRCDVQDNRITHSAGADWRARSSFAALMIHAGPGSPGDYADADVSGNVIDCGSRRACGFGLLLGAEPWHESKLYGGSYHDNVVRNAQQGLAINGATGPIIVYNNAVEHSGGAPNNACQGQSSRRTTSAYSLAPESARFVDLSRDRMRSRYATQSFKSCLLNGWNMQSCAQLSGVPSQLPCAEDAGVAYDVDYCCRR